MGKGPTKREGTANPKCQGHQTKEFPQFRKGSNTKWKRRSAQFETFSQKENGRTGKQHRHAYQRYVLPRSWNTNGPSQIQETCAPGQLAPHLVGGHSSFAARRKKHGGLTGPISAGTSSGPPREQHGGRTLGGASRTPEGFPILP